METSFNINLVWKLAFEKDSATGDWGCYCKTCCAIRGGMPSEGFWLPAEAASYLGVNIKTLAFWRSQPTAYTALPYKRIGDRVFYSISEVKKFAVQRLAYQKERGWINIHGAKSNVRALEIWFARERGVKLKHLAKQFNMSTTNVAKLAWGIERHLTRLEEAELKQQKGKLKR